MSDVVVTPELLARLEFLRSAACAGCGARRDLTELDGSLACWACFAARVRVETDAALPGRAPLGKVAPSPSSFSNRLPAGAGGPLGPEGLKQAIEKYSQETRWYLR